jgi:hypothetical protein
MPSPESPNLSRAPLPREARDEAQLMLGQIHGLVWLAVEEADTWLPPDYGENVEPELTANDIRAAALDVHPNFGIVHAAINSGAFDESLRRVGLAGAQGRAKKKGVLSALSRYFRIRRESVRSNLASLRDSLGWSATLLGSIKTALHAEIERVPGAAAAAEAIGEFVDLLSRAAEQAERGETASKTKSPRSGSQA